MALTAPSIDVTRRRAAIVGRNLQSLIGHFNIDPTRAFDVLLDVASANIVHHHVFLRELIAHVRRRPSPHDRAAPAPSSELPPGLLEGEEGDVACAQILGFKFQHYGPDGPAKGERIPLQLGLLAAVLIGDGIISLADLYPHLYPADADMAAEYRAAQKAAGKVGPSAQNALTMARPLDSGSRADAADASSAAKAEEQSLPPKNQKVLLLRALLGVGDLDHALFILAKFPWLSSTYPDIAHLLMRLLDVIIGPAADPLGPVASNPALAELGPLDGVRTRYSTSERGVVPATPWTVELTGYAYPNPRNPPVETNYFYAPWRYRLPRAQTADEATTIVLQLMRFVGTRAHQDMAFLTRLLRVGRKAIAEGDAETRSTWADVIRHHLLPALSLSGANSALSIDLWGLLSLYSDEERFAFYGEWAEVTYGSATRTFGRPTTARPEMVTVKATEERVARQLCQRMSKDNFRQIGRKVAKMAHANPTLLFDMVIHQCKTYDNLIEPFIDSARYLSETGYDVLNYSLLAWLAKGENRAKAGGLNASLWLQNLAKFTAGLFRRYNVDARPLIRYVLAQLSDGNTDDLLVLRQLFAAVAAVDIISPLDISPAQLAGLGGGPVLRREVLNPTFDRQRLPPPRALERLRKSFLTTELVAPLLVRIALARQQVAFPDEAEMEYIDNEARIPSVRTLATAFDNVRTD